MTQAIQSLDFAARAKEHAQKLEALKQDPEVKRELGRLKKASQDIEAIFLKQLIGEMRKGQTEGIFGKSIESQMYSDYLDEAVAQKIATARGIGIAETLYKTLEGVTLRSFAAKHADGAKS
jgi:flagellar protein FlgJ